MSDAALWFLGHGTTIGIFNVGSGRAQGQGVRRYVRWLAAAG